MNELRNYTITATLGSNTETIRFQEIDDTEATFAAIFKVLDKANKGTTSRIWRKGEIVLAGPDGIIRTMPAKASA